MSVPPLRPYTRGREPVPVPTAHEAADFDRVSIQERGVPEAALMESAGRAAAELIQRLHPRGEVVGLVGSGNNGGDALVVLRTLRAWGRPVRAILGGQRPEPDPLLHGWELPTEVDEALDDQALAGRLAGAGVVVDGLLGTGMRGAPRPRQARLIRATGQGPAPVVALDVPSGVDAQSGAMAGEAVDAAVTVAFGWPKLGCLLHPGRGRVGRLVVAEIGFPPVGDHTWPAWLITPGWGAERRPRRAPDTHKNRVGSLLLVAGSPGMAGAAVLAARAALRTGVGYLRLASHPANRPILQEAVPDAPFLDATDPQELAAALEASRAIAVGPGLGTGADAQAILQTLSALGPERDAPPRVVDADALNLLARESGVPGPLGGWGGASVLTPHPGEMARLLDVSLDDVQADRPAAARALASTTGSVVILKGAPTLVAGPDGRLGVASMGGSELAVAGMGDVLTGTVASLLAQGLTPLDAAGLALVLTARAAQRRGAGVGLVASDVPDEIPAALDELGRGHTDLAEPWVLLDMDPAR